MGSRDSFATNTLLDADGSRAQDGKAFALVVTHLALPTQVHLDLRVAAAEQVTTPDLNPLVGNSIDGIMFDDVGNRTPTTCSARIPANRGARDSLARYGALPKPPPISRAPTPPMRGRAAKLTRPNRANRSISHPERSSRCRAAGR